MGRLDYGCIARNIMQGIAGKTAFGIELEYVFQAISRNAILSGYVNCRLF